MFLSRWCQDGHLAIAEKSHCVCGYVHHCNRECWVLQAILLLVASYSSE